MTPFINLLTLVFIALLGGVLTKLGIDVKAHWDDLSSASGTLALLAVTGVVTAGTMLAHHIKQTTLWGKVEGPNEAARSSMYTGACGCKVAPLLALAVLGGSMLIGCSNQAAQLQPQIVGADAAAISGRSLYAAKSMSASIAHKLSVDLHVADTGFQSALSSIQSGGSPAQTTLNEILAALDAIAVDLQSTPKGQAAAARIKLARAASANKKVITPGEVILIIQLAEVLVPGTIQELNLIFSGSPVTVADCQTALVKFETDLAAFDQAIAN